MGILCQGRGSAANSTVCYCLRITEIDTDKKEVLFERFLSNERDEPPDIDVDFEHERREDLIQWIYDNWTRERAALAATVISYRTRSAIRDVGKALGLSPDTLSVMANTVWGSGGKGLNLKYIRDAGLNPDDQRLSLALELSETLIGFPRHLSQHVGGFILTAERLDELIPYPECSNERPHRRRMGQRRSRRARHLQDRHAGARHADGAPQKLRVDRKALWQASRPRHADRRRQSLWHAMQGRFDRRVPGREPGADVDAAEAQAEKIL